MTFRRRTTLIGLSLQPYETMICRVRRQGKLAEVSTLTRAPIPASAFKTEPKRAGQELRAHLRTAHIRPESCVVCLPLSWAFTSELDLPDLSKPDLQSFIRLEAERRFPLAPDDLVLAVAQRKRPDETASPAASCRSLLVGIPAECLSNVEKALRSARLRPLSMTFAIAALAGEHARDHCALIQVGKGFVDFAVVADDTSPILRNLAWQESSGAESGLDGDVATQEEVPFDSREMARQLRITLAQIPSNQRDSVERAVLYGGGEWPETATDLLRESLAGLGMTLEEGRSAESVAATRTLLGQTSAIELYVQKKTHMPTVMARFSARSVRWALGVAGAAILLLMAAFGLQGWQLAQLENQWSEIGPRVEAAKSLQERVRKYRSWYDDSIPSLALLEKLASAFPGEGSVWVKNLRVKDRTSATCSGVASNRTAWMQVMDRLGKNKDLDELQVVQARGDTPFSFTLTFRWKGKDAGGF